MELLSQYVIKGKLTKGTLLYKVTQLGYSPVSTAFIKPTVCTNDTIEDGTVASLRYLMFHENYVKPYSNEFILTNLLTKAF